MPTLHRITPCLWFDTQAEPAAELYTSVFPDSRITHVARYPEAGHEIHGKPPGSVMTVAFELAGQHFTALNGGPHFQFSPAVSFEIRCADQAEVDHYWHKLSEGGPVEAQQCGWLADRFGLSWQVVPQALIDFLADPDPTRRDRVMTAMLQMKKLDVATLKRAHTG